MFKIRREQKEAFALVFPRPVEPCTTCLIVRFVDIEGLYLGGYDDRVDPPEGTTKGASRVKGYASEDDKGRIFINRDLDGSWKRDTQGIVITVQVGPPSVPIPPGTQIEWSFEDPDDPSNEDPRMHRDAGKILDPNDYDDSGKKTAAKDGDNNPYTTPKGEPTGKAKPGFAEAEARYPFSNDKTEIDTSTRLSKVRFNVGDTAGDNYRVTAKITPKAPITTTTPAVTGVMTVWNRVDVEYVRMLSADELPLAELSQHFDLAFAQVDISEKRVTDESYDYPYMGTDQKTAEQRCSSYATRWAGQFTREGQPGWFFIVAGNRLRPEKHEMIVYEGAAFARGRWIQLPRGTVLADVPVTARVFNATKLTTPDPPWPANPDLYVSFDVLTPVLHLGDWWLPIDPHQFFEVDDPDHSFLDADLGTYGFGENTIIPVQILNEGEESYYGVGHSPFGFVAADGHSYFGGKVFVFTKMSKPGPRIVTLCHELCHAFDNAHMCGNFTWADAPVRSACAMCYLRSFLLDDGKPRRPIRWTQNRRSADFCAVHLRRMRSYHLQDNPGLGWK